MKIQAKRWKAGVLQKLLHILGVAVILLFVGGCSTTEYYTDRPEVLPSLYSNVRPPERFQRNATVLLQTADQVGIDQACQPQFGSPPAGMKTDACEIGGRIIAPNPCAYPDTDVYARILCHELGHANGWPSTHGS